MRGAVLCLMICTVLLGAACLAICIKSTQDGNMGWAIVTGICVFVNGGTAAINLRTYLDM